MKRLAALLLLLATVATADAQIVTDTLDNRRYYPLEVGNEWQYTSIAFGTPIPSWTRIRIISDTLVDGRRYFERLTEHFGENEDNRIDWLRHNDVGAVLFFDDIEADTADIDTTTYWYHADFGDTLEGEFGEEYVGGGYERTFYLDDAIEIEVAAIKTLQVPDPLEGTTHYVSKVYAADFGRVAEGFFDGPGAYLSYARIGGVEFGTAPITVGGDREDAPPPKPLAVYPNPAEHSVTLEYEPALMAEVHLCDVLGRCYTIDAARGANGRTVQLDVSGLSAGTYVLMVSGKARSRESAVLTVVR